MRTVAFFSVRAFDSCTLHVALRILFLSLCTLTANHVLDAYHPPSMHVWWKRYHKRPIRKKYNNNRGKDYARQLPATFWWYRIVILLS